MGAVNAEWARRVRAAGSIVVAEIDDSNGEPGYPLCDPASPGYWFGWHRDRKVALRHARRLMGLDPGGIA